MSPSLTPLQADIELKKILGQDLHHEDGFMYQLDGPQMCPLSAMSPFAYRDDECWYIPGEGVDPITETTEWRLFKL